MPSFEQEPESVPSSIGDTIKDKLEVVRERVTVKLDEAANWLNNVAERDATLADAAKAGAVLTVIGAAALGVAHADSAAKVLDDLEHQLDTLRSITNYALRTGMEIASQEGATPVDVMVGVENTFVNTATGFTVIEMVDTGINMLQPEFREKVDAVGKNIGTLTAAGITVTAILAAPVIVKKNGESLKVSDTVFPAAAKLLRFIAHGKNSEDDQNADKIEYQ